MNQQSFIALAQDMPKKSRRRKFLEEMNAAIPWEQLVEVIQKYFPEKNRGRKRTSLEHLLRCMCLQQWYKLSDPGVEDAINDSLAFQWFLGIDILEEASIDESTICKFRHVLEEKDALKKIFDTIQKYLRMRGYIMNEGTITDATIIQASSSTKNKSGARDPEMSSTRKGNTYHFGMKSHIGVDSGSGLVHSVATTTARCHDKTKQSDLLHGKEKAIYGDKAYYSDKDKQEFQKKGVYYGVTTKAQRNKPLSNEQKTMNAQVQPTRSKVEHIFGIVKHLWGYRKVRYKGLYKNTCQQYLLYGLANIYKVRVQLLEETG